MPTQSLKGKSPELDKTVFLAPNAFLIGDVKAGANSSFWYNVTVRGDVAPIQIGSETNIQDGTVIHGTYMKHNVCIGNRVTVGHQAMLHGCEIGDRCLIGMASVIMDGVKVGSDCLVGAGSLLSPGSEFPSGKLILGRPGKVIRDLTQAELEWINKSADNYLHYLSWYQEA